MFAIIHYLYFITQTKAKDIKFWKKYIKLLHSSLKIQYPPVLDPQNEKKEKMFQEHSKWVDPSIIRTLLQQGLEKREGSDSRIYLVGSDGIKYRFYSWL